MVKPVKLGKTVRQSFSKINELLDMPNLIEVQKESFDWFVKEGLREVLEDVSPLVDYSGNLNIEFIDYSIGEKTKYPVEECKERDVNYAAPLEVKVRLSNKLTGEVTDSKVFMGDIPLMTDTGTFVINGAERVIVSQIVRSPGIYYESIVDKSDKKTFTTTVIPYRGAWLEYETDANDIFYVRIDKNRKIPVTVLIRALGVGEDNASRDDDVIAMFGNDVKILETLKKDTSETDALKNGCTPREEALKEIYK